MRRCVAFGGALVAHLLIAPYAYAEAPERRYDFHIEESALGPAITALVRHTEKNVLFPYELASETGMNPVIGRYTIEEALEVMLRDTKFSGGLSDNGVLFIAVSDEEMPKDRENEMAGEKLRKGLLASVAAFLGVSAGAQDLEAIDDNASSDPREPEPLDEIIVTGTNIRGAANPASPVFVFDREDIRLSGAATTQDFIRTLPQNLDLSENTAGSLAGDQSWLSAATAGVNIRGLGGSATLTLVNGRRLAAGGGRGNFVDISLIPVIAIERIEVLTDGASAIYGSDAVAGVVNFILREDYEGAETQLRGATATRGGRTPDELQAGQTFGKSWSSGNVMISYEYFHRDNLDSNDRSFTEAALDRSDLLPEERRHSVLVNGRQEISDRLELFGTGSFSDRDAVNELIEVFSGGQISRDAEDTQFNATLGAVRTFENNWQVDLSGGYSRNAADTFDLTDGSPEFEIDTEFEMWTADVVADGALFETPGGPVRVAVGGHYRSEDFLRSTLRIPIASEDRIELDRDVYAAFAELNLPLVGETNRRPGVYTLDVSAAVRFEDFSDVGSSTDPKFGFRYAPVEGLSFRGTYSTAFQAPRFFDLGFNQSINAVPGAFFPPAPGATAPNPDLIILAGGNLLLQPETSRNFTAGLDFEPAFAPSVTLSLTYFDIDFDDRVGRPGPSAFSVFTDPGAFGSSLVFDPDVAVVTALFAEPNFLNNFGVQPEDVRVIFDNRRQNLAAAEVRGLDFDLDYVKETSAGSFSFGLDGSYLFDFIEQTSPVAEPVQTLNTVGNPIDLRLRGSASWSRAGYGAAVFVNYADDYTSTATGPAVPVDSWTTVDLNLSYDTSFAFADTAIDNTRLNLNFRNLFDEAPPFVEQSLVPGINFDGTNANALGRYIALSITKTW